MKTRGEILRRTGRATIFLEQLGFTVVTVRTDAATELDATLQAGDLQPVHGYPLALSS